MSIVTRVLLHPVESLWRLMSVTVYPLIVTYAWGLRHEGGLRLRGLPVVERVPGAGIRLGRRVMLNSSNAGYHINLFGPVKLFADRPGAVIDIGDETRLHGTCIHAYERVTIGRRCLVAGNVQIIDGSGHDLSFDDPARRIHTVGGARPVTIEDDVWIGAHCIILPGVRIGRGSVVAAGSVVIRDVPPMCIAGGNPAVVLREAAESR